MEVPSAISVLVGVGTTVVVGLWKIFSLHKDISLVELKVDNLEKVVAANKLDVDLLEKNILDSLRRIEDRLNNLVDRK